VHLSGTESKDFKTSTSTTCKSPFINLIILLVEFAVILNSAFFKTKNPKGILMKIFTTILALILGINAYATTPQNNDNWIKDQNDQTDTLAIPLDSSEAEEAQEEKELLEEQKKQKLLNKPATQPHNH
jgi:hypothetical protein